MAKSQPETKPEPELDIALLTAFVIAFAELHPDDRCGEDAGLGYFEPFSFFTRGSSDWGAYYMLQIETVKNYAEVLRKIVAAEREHHPEWHWMNDEEYFRPFLFRHAGVRVDAGKWGIVYLTPKPSGKSHSDKWRIASVNDDKGWLNRCDF